MQRTRKEPLAVGPFGSRVLELHKEKGLTITQAFDYVGTVELGYSRPEWADMRGVHSQSVWESVDLAKKTLQDES